MTIAASTRRAGPFTGTGASVDYPFTFKIFSPEHVRVYVADQNGSERELDYPAEYTVAPNPQQETHPGGIVRLVTPLQQGEIATIISRMDIVQPADYRNQGGLYPEALNNSFDRLTMICQEIRALIDGMRLPSARARHFLRWNDQGVLENIAFDPQTLESGVGEARRLIDQLSQTVQSLGVDALTTQVNALAQDLQDADIPGLRSDLDDLAQQLVQAKLDELRTELAAIRRQVEALDLDEIRRKVGEIEAAIAAIDASDLATLNQKITAVEQGVQTLGGDLSALSGRVQNIETAIPGIGVSIREAQQTASQALQTASAAEATANAALPTTGGTLTGHVLTRYSHPWVGAGYDNTSDNPAGTFLDAYRHGIIQGSQQIRFQSDGGTHYALQLTPPGDATRERREDFFRVDLGGLWHKAYGVLHDYFIDGDDLHHDWFPNHYAGAEVWWHKRMGLKICQMRVIAEPGQFGTASSLYHPVHLPTVFKGMATAIGWAITLPNNGARSVYARLEKPSELKVTGFNSSNSRSQAEFLIIGYSDQ